MAALPSVKPITLEEFSRLPRDGQKHEAAGGELITMPPAKSLHSRIARRISKTLESSLESGESEMFLEAGYILSLTPLTVCQADVSVLSKDRIRATPPDSYFEGPPEIAIEIVSPSDSAEYMETKVREYLDFGAIEVWVVYPKTKHLHVFSRTGELKVLSESQTIECPDLLPGFSAKAADFFLR